VILNRNSGNFVLLAILPGLLLSQIGSSQVNASTKIAQTSESIARQTPNRSTDQLRQMALELVNRDRAQQSLAPLVEDPLLSGAAGLHALDMANRGYFDHHNPAGQEPTERFAAVGGKGGVAENLVYITISRDKQINGQLLADFQQMWMNSPPHRRNLLNDQCTYFGYGIAISPDGDRVYAVQKFSR
jgi:uncharacterized protein YkwD